jgi:hypothetical protein
MEQESKFETWAIVELFGHQVIAGMVSEQVIGPGAFLRVDVPAVDGSPAFTRFFGQGAIYSITPVSEEVARLAVKRYAPKPVNIYMPLLAGSISKQDAEFLDRYPEDEDENEPDPDDFDPDWD